VQAEDIALVREDIALVREIPAKQEIHVIHEEIRSVRDQHIDSKEDLNVIKRYNLQYRRIRCSLERW